MRCTKLFLAFLSSIVNSIFEMIKEAMKLTSQWIGENNNFFQPGRAQRGFEELAGSLPVIHGSGVHPFGC